MLERVLSAARSRLLAEERALLRDLGATLARLDVVAEDQALFERSVRQLDELFLLVVVGEFNSGKSAFINALLGQPVLEEGVTPTTSRIGLLRFGEAVTRQEGGGVDVITAPVPMLREINIVDTPGTNAVIRGHEALTRDFVPRSDLVLFVTSADRPFTESEREFLEAIRDWGKKVLVVLNKIDILETPEDVERVVAFIRDSARSLLGFVPEVFPVSGRQALRAKTGRGGPEMLDASRFEALERYIVATLDQKERLRLKLLNPIGVGSRLVDVHLSATRERIDLLRDDVAAIETIEAQLAAYREDMGRDFRFRLADVENVLHGFAARGNDFIDRTLRLARIFDLVKQSKLKRDFEREVVADLPRVVEARVDEVIDWMVASHVKQWRAVVERLDERKGKHEGRMLGRVDGAFEADRARLLETVKRETRRVVETYDQEAEANRLADSVRIAVAGTAFIQVGALGLGALMTMAATSTLADITGLLAAGVVSVLGLLVLPARRRAARDELRTKADHLRQRLLVALTGQFDRELEHSLQRIAEAIAPYTRFVRSERARLTAVGSDLERIGQALDGLRAAIERAP